jgi:uncharacterized protein involved in outer membrane biogenesis
VSKSVKYILVAVAVLLILVLIPALVPLEKYKSVIETKVQDAIGRELTIDGNISLSILPRPKVKIDGIKLALLPSLTYLKLNQQKQQLQSALYFLEKSLYLTSSLKTQRLCLRN